MAFIDKSSGAVDTAIFVAIFVIGVVSEILLRLVWDVGTLLVTFLLIFYLFLYAYIVYRGSHTTLVGAQVADNFYYLGFLYTVCALGIALYKFGDSSNVDQQGDVLRLIVGDLGIGLSTTVVGLALRVIFTQFRNTPEDIENRISTRLRQRATVVEGQFLDSMQRFEAVSYRLVELAQRTEDVVTEVLAPFPDTVKMARDQAIESIQDAFSELPKLVEIVSASFRTLESPTQELSKKFTDAVAELNSLTARIRETAAWLDRPAIEQVISDTTAKGIEEPLQGLREQVNTLSQSLGNLTESVNQIQISDETLNGKLAEIGDTVEAKVQSGVDKAQKGLKTATDKIEKALEEKVEEIGDLKVTRKKKWFRKKT